MTLSPAQAAITASVGLPPDADLDMRLTRAERLIEGLGKGLAQLKIDTRSGLADLEAAITASVGLPPDADLDMRLTRAERLIEGLGKGLAQLKIDTRSGLADLEAKFREEIEEIKTEISEVRELTGKAHVGDVGMEFAGLGWVIVGLTLATVPNFVYSVSKPIVDYLIWFNYTH